MDAIAAAAAAAYRMRGDGISADAGWGIPVLETFNIVGDLAGFWEWTNDSLYSMNSTVPLTEFSKTVLDKEGQEE